MSNVERYLGRLIGLLDEIKDEHRALSSIPFPSAVEAKMKQRIESWVNLPARAILCSLVSLQPVDVAA